MLNFRIDERPLNIIQIQKLYFSHFFLINPRQKTARPLSLGKLSVLWNGLMPQPVYPDIHYPWVIRWSGCISLRIRTPPKQRTTVLHQSISSGTRQMHAVQHPFTGAGDNLSDFELGIVNSIQTTNPHSDVRLCFFHLGQSAFRYVQPPPPSE